MVLRIKKDILRRLYMSIFVFIMIFAPPFLPNIHYLLALYAVGSIILGYRKRVQSVLVKANMYRWILLILILTCYAIVVFMINATIYNDIVQLGQYTMLFVRFWGLTIIMVSCSSYILCFMDRHMYSWFDFIGWVMGAGMIQTFFAFTALTVPSVREFFLYFLRKFSGTDLFNYEWFTATRAYGFSTSMVDQFGFGMGLIAGILLFYGIIHKRVYILYSLMVFAAGLINARTTIIIYAISVLISILFFLMQNDIKTIFKWIGSMLLIIGGAFIGYIVISNYSEQTWSWIESGVEEVINIFSGNDTRQDFGTRLFAERSWALPEGIRLIIGSGHSIYGAEGYLHSDVGYINDIWFVGILGVIGFYGYMGYMFVQCYNLSNNNFQKVTIIFLVVSAMAFNIKAFVIAYSPGTSVMFSILFVFTFMFKEKI